MRILRFLLIPSILLIAAGVCYVMGPTGPPWAKEEFLFTKTSFTGDRIGILHVRILRPWVGRDFATVSKEELWHRSTGERALVRERRAGETRATDFDLQGRVTRQALTGAGNRNAVVSAPPWLWEVEPSVAPWGLSGETAEEGYESGSVYLNGDREDWDELYDLMPSP